MEERVDSEIESSTKIREDLIFADLHIHSKYSRACSKDLNFPNLTKWARVKGLDLLGTGDFTHPKWLEEIKALREENGIFYQKDEVGEFPFILTSEISLIYSQDGKGRRVHLVYFAPTIDAVNKINSWLDSKGRRDYDGRPIFKISCRDFIAKMEEIDPMIEVIPAHIWTPWFGIFGSEGGFDSLKDVFLDKIHLVHAIETGISSDPLMNWKIKDLDNISIVSFSDSHSFWPWRLGRESTIFNKPKEKLTYNELIRQIREKDFYGTIETDPFYGKYHYDGHRNCNFSSSPEETRKLKGICPVCGKPLTIGVEYRVDALNHLGVSDHKKKKFYYRVLPLHEIISLHLSSGVASKKVWNVFNNLMQGFQNEINVLIYASKEELMKVLNDPTLVDLILINRDGKIEVKPGYDGVYGRVVLGGKEIVVGDETESNLAKPNSSEDDKISEKVNGDSEVQKAKIKGVQKKLF